MTAVLLVVPQYAESAKDTAVVIEPLTLLISALRALANSRVALAAESLALRSSRQSTNAPPMSRCSSARLRLTSLSGGAQMSSYSDPKGGGNG